MPATAAFLFGVQGDAVVAAVGERAFFALCVGDESAHVFCLEDAEVVS